MKKDFSAQESGLQGPDWCKKGKSLISPSTGKRVKRHETERIGLVQKGLSIP